MSANRSKFGASKIIERCGCNSFTEARGALRSLTARFSIIRRAQDISFTPDMREKLIWGGIRGNEDGTLTAYIEVCKRISR